MNLLRPIVTLAIGAALCLGFVTVNSAQAEPQNAERTLFTVLTGAQEVPPGSGDPNGVGVAVLHVTASTGTVNYALAVVRLAGEITSVHVHNAPRGQRGEDVFDLENPVDGFVSGTVEINPADAGAIIANPHDYYVEVHTTAFPNGAIRGQL
jgi:CHRD domain-containing protein